MPCDTVITFPRNWFKWNENVHTNLYVNVAAFIQSPKISQHSLPTGECINWCIHTMEYYLGIKKMKYWLKTTWMHPRSIMLSEKPTSRHLHNILEKRKPAIADTWMASWGVDGNWLQKGTRAGDYLFWKNSKLHLKRFYLSSLTKRVPNLLKEKALKRGLRYLYFTSLEIPVGNHWFYWQGLYTNLM